MKTYQHFMSCGGPTRNSSAAQEGPATPVGDSLLYFQGQGSDGDDENTLFFRPANTLTCLKKDSRGKTNARFEPLGSRQHDHVINLLASEAALPPVRGGERNRSHVSESGEKQKDFQNAGFGKG